jgi:hypothetical protein
MTNKLVGANKNTSKGLAVQAMAAIAKLIVFIFRTVRKALLQLAQLEVWE